MGSNFENIPRFADLPVNKNAPADSSWGVFGADDRLGCLNFLTPAGVVAGARLVQTGKVFRLDAYLDGIDPPLFSRAPPEHRVTTLGPLAHDDVLDNFNTQASSQWDGFGHIGHPRHGAFYNGVTPADQVRGGAHGHGVDTWKNRIVGRGALIDVFGWCKAVGRAVEPLSGNSYTLEELKAALAWQGTVLAPGSIVLVRTGWLETYQATPRSQREAMVSKGLSFDAIGLRPGRDLVEWLWDSRVAALGTDNPSVEACPIPLHSEHALHFMALPLLGLPLGELFELAALAADCAEDRRYEFMLTSAPLMVRGGIASPPNALAIK